MLPVETIEALFPSADAVGKIALHPLTVARAALLEMLGVECAKGVSLDQILAAAWVLNLSDGEVLSVAGAHDRTAAFSKWCEKCNPDLYELAAPVTGRIVAAFSTYVPPAPEGNSQTVYASEHGFGWPLEIAEALCHEYGMAFDAALAVPVSRAYGMLCCARQRNGGKNGAPDYYERIAMAKASAQFRKMREEQEARAKAEAEKKHNADAEVKDNG